MTKFSDDEIVTKLDARDRAGGWMVATLMGLPVILAVLFAAAFFTGHAALVQNENVQIVIAIVVGATILITFIRFARKVGPAVDVYDPAIVRKRIDAYHRYWRWLLLLGLVSTSIWAFIVSRYLADLAQTNRLVALAWGVTLITNVVPYSLLSIAGPGWFSRELHSIINDEFVRDLHARTTRLGYWTLLVAVAGTLVIAICRPDLTPQVLAWALYAGFAIPALFYVISDWRASLNIDSRDV